ncbi:phospholipid-binding protein MlaC [Tropicimonas sp. IMCC34043]|uniref:MlaC/ttg2D family ABC transporter substrate-binding protein n=1 Tax=Tropicimonas sp. IMCC34043 TaxID=2248760 RepID=UPI000E28521C|nr:ABC transporter substrate-binding protein [Tropicimonas sp. IMCC34043]
MPIDLHRRQFVRRVGLGLAALAAAPTAGWALTTDQAASLVNQVVDDINRVINSGKSEAAIYKEFEKIFGKYADVQGIALLALGADRKRASQAQLVAYVEAFKGYISRKYGKRFREFIGGRLEETGSKAVKSYVEVKTIAYLRGEDPFDVTFLVSDRSGKPKFFNLYIEGVNMVLTEKTEIGSMLDRQKGNIDGLIKQLNATS